MKELTRNPSVNSELDFELAERLGKTLDDLDAISLSIIEDLRDALWKEWIAAGIAEELIQSN
jgi:hypothetical protein